MVSSLWNGDVVAAGEIDRIERRQVACHRRRDAGALDAVCGARAPSAVVAAEQDDDVPPVRRMSAWDRCGSSVIGSPFLDHRFDHPSRAKGISTGPIPDAGKCGRDSAG